MTSHAIQRAKERYGLDLTLDDLKALVDQIHNNQAVLVKIEASGARQYIVHHGTVAVIVVFSRIADRIITFVPRSNAGRNCTSLKQVNGVGKNRHGGRRAKRHWRPRPRREREVDMSEVE